MEKQTYFHGIGRRKTAIAQVKLLHGEGAIIINGVPYEDRITRLEHRQIILRPFLVTESIGKFNAIIRIFGGGISGQCGAISHGISRALVKVDGNLKSVLRQNGLLTRDSRTKERKKVGLKRARKAPQYTKR